MRNLDMHTSRRAGSQRGFALILVILILTGMLLIGVPFAISMRLSSSRAQTSLANAHARYGAEGAYNHAIACLMQTQEQHDPWPLTLDNVTDDYFESYTVDLPAELEVVFEPDYDINEDSDRAEDDPYIDLYISPDELSTRNPRGSIWSVDVEDEQGKINPVSYTHLTLPTTPYV